MQIEVPFNYINILAFIKLLQFENKRSIKLNTLFKYHQTLLEEVINNYNDKNNEFFQEKDKWTGEIEFTTNDEININNFLNEFSHMFYIENDTIYLEDEITYEDLIEQEILMRQEQEISNRFLSANDNDKLFEILNIKKIKTVLEKYNKIEEGIEHCYSKLNYNDDSETIEKLKKLLIMRAVFLNNIYQNSNYIIDAFRIESVRINASNDNCKYDKYPIDLNLWKQSDYYEDMEDDLGDMDDRFYDIFQYAIFGKTSLVTEKTHNMLENLCFFEDKDNSHIEDDCFDMDFKFNDNYNEDKVYYFIDNEETDFAFYMTYIDKLNEYIQKNGNQDNLIKIKNRLLYALDMPKLCLFKSENFTKELEKVKEIEVEQDDFEFIEDEVRFMVDEVFETEKDENTIKKLLFISTYYELTKDKEIKKILNKHIDNINYDAYSKIIFDDQKGYSKKKYKRK